MPEAIKLILLRTRGNPDQFFRNLRTVNCADVNAKSSVMKNPVLSTANLYLKNITYCRIVKNSLQQKKNKTIHMIDLDIKLFILFVLIYRLLR